MRISLTKMSFQHLYIPAVFMLAISVVEKCYLIGVLVSIHLITNVEQFFLYLIAICVSFIMCLFK